MICWLPFALLLFPLTADTTKVPEPAKEAQTAAQRQVKEIYKADYAARGADAKRLLAEKLLKKALESRTDPPVFYVLLRESRDLAVESGSAETAVKAVEETCAAFEVDAVAWKTAAAEGLAKSARAPGDAAALVDFALAAGNEAVNADDYKAARKMAETAAAAAKRAKDGALLSSSSKDFGEEAAALQKKFEAVKPSLEILKKDPKSSAANLAVGKFLCFAKGDWKRGLPHLAGGSDAAFISIAERDLACGGAAAQQVEVGDGWWEAAQVSSGPEKAAMRIRGATWYARALPGLSALAKDRALARIEELAEEGSPRPRPGVERPAGLAVVRFNGKDLQGWKPVSGVWRATAGNLASSGGNENRFLRSFVQTTWVRITFEFLGGNPGLYFTSSKEAKGGTGINLDAEAWNNGEIRRAVDMSRWNRIEVNLEGGSLKFHLNGLEAYSGFVSLPSYLYVKAQRGELKVRKLVAIGFQPDG